MSLKVTPSFLDVSFTSVSDSDAVANVRPGGTMWLRNVGGNLNILAMSGSSLRSFDRRLTLANPRPAARMRPGTGATVAAWSRPAARNNSDRDGGSQVV